MNVRLAAACAALAFIPCAISIAQSEPDGISGPELAGRLLKKQEGSTYVRMRMLTSGGVLQLQLKSRVSRTGSEVVYRVLFPKERKGEAVLLRKSGGGLSGTHFIPPDKVESIGGANDAEPLFGSAISYEDAVENVYAWKQQTTVGTEEIGGTPCVILDSKPEKGQSPYSSVRTWVDTKRMVPLRIEKYRPGGKLVRQVVITRMLVEAGESMPADLSIKGPGGKTTVIEGSRIKRGAAFDDSEFTSEGIRQISVPRQSNGE